MNWKKTTAYFTWQSLQVLPSISKFTRAWGYYPDWCNFLKPGRSTISDEQAWLSFPALKFLEQYLTKDHKVFEYGGGGSTLFFCKRAGFVATVENDKAWFADISKIIQQKGYTHWKGDFQEGEPRTDGRTNVDPADPALFGSNGKDLRGLTYEKYAKNIHQYPENFFDVVLVDGRARPSCIFEAFKYLKINGILVADNMERAYYWTVINTHLKGCFEIVVEGLAPTPYHPDFTQTVVFKKIM